MAKADGTSLLHPQRGRRGHLFAVGAAMSLALSLAGCGPAPPSDEAQRRRAAAVEATPDEAELLRLVLAAMGSASGNRCVEAATAGAEHRPRIWADILYMDGVRRHLRAGEGRFDELGSRYALAAPRRPAALLLPEPARQGGLRVCGETVTFYTPVYERELAFVVALTRHATPGDMGDMVEYWVFARGDGRWDRLAYGHTTIGGRPVI